MTQLSPSANFQTVINGLIELHRFGDADDTPEAEAVRDALDEPLQSLSPAEMQCAKRFSEDLYSLTQRACCRVPVIRPQI